MSNTQDQLNSLFSSRDKENRISGQTICGDLDLLIDREGNWHYNGTPIGRKELIYLFSSVLHKDDDNSYWLITPAEKGKILVEDAPFMAVELFVKGEGKKQELTFRINIGQNVTTSASNPLTFRINEETGEPSPYILVRDNLEAKITRSVYYQIVELGVETKIFGQNCYGVWSDNEFFKIGEL